MSKCSKWRYKRVVRYEGNLVNELNLQGSEGWELVSCHPVENTSLKETVWVCFLKRPEK